MSKQQALNNLHITEVYTDYSPVKKKCGKYSGLQALHMRINISDDICRLLFVFNTLSLGKDPSKRSL